MRVYNPVDVKSHSARNTRQKSTQEAPSSASLGGITVSQNQKISPNEFTKTLTEYGYESVGIDNVHAHGQFSKRGGVIDLWVERYKIPARIDFIGEKIEAIYLFNPLTQNSEKTLNSLHIIPYKSTPTFAPKWAKKQIGKNERLFLSDINQGDLIVHIDHGIGRFVSVDYRELEPGNGKTYLIVDYAKGDKLYVPIDQIERVTKYIGSPGRKPPLSYLGTGAWEKTKQKVKESIVDIAKDLLALYAKRETATRPKYSADTPWQKQLEDDFEFEETQDQIKTISEIKKDLESLKPMDRLLIGDVGFGKTEVAIRTAFKVAQEGKQVAILVPTTILAEQHYHLFKSRLTQFPIEVSILSRFKEAKEQKKIIESLKIGKSDIVIGTHRLLSGDVEFKNLGLVIIDEEHRFGVAAKEKLKQLRTEVDILSMSATPIPRTLHMALTKIRDVSSLNTPPPNRLPIQTFVGDYDLEKVKTALESEISRGGQVYYLFNNVAGIANKAIQIRKLVPKAKIIYAHGQMNEKELEEAMVQFYSEEADILVCTTIIGAGLDMPNVNTIIIENSQKFGLADLYQLRGRVGRSERQAHAYLFYPKGYVPKGNILERLSTMEQASELGSGFRIATKDLEIRGAGNLLGVQQSGSIALVGFELYIQLLAQAVEKIKN